MYITGVKTCRVGEPPLFIFTAAPPQSLPYRSYRTMITGLFNNKVFGGIFINDKLFTR